MKQDCCFNFIISHSKQSNFITWNLTLKDVVGWLSITTRRPLLPQHPIPASRYLKEDKGFQVPYIIYKSCLTDSEGNLLQHLGIYLVIEYNFNMILVEKKKKTKTQLFNLQ